MLVEANSQNLIVDAKELRQYFGIEYTYNLGDILKQFMRFLEKLFLNLFNLVVSEVEKIASENPNKIYCTNVKRNPDVKKAK